MLDSEEQVRTSAVVSAEVGIRPSFYWLDETAAVSEEERSYAEASARWMKSDCQDDAVVVQNFVGLPCQVFAGGCRRRSSGEQCGGVCSVVMLGGVVIAGYHQCGWAGPG